MAFYTEIIVNELILIRVQHVPLSIDNDLQTMSSLFTCLSAIKSWLDIVLKFEAADYIGFPFFFWKQFRTIMLILIRMASLGDPAWDVDLVRRTVDLPAVLDQMASNLEHLQNIARLKLHTQENVFSKPFKLVNVLKSWSLSVYNEAGPVTETGTSPIPPDNLATLTECGLHEDQQTAGEAAVNQQMQPPDMDAFPSLDQDLWNEDVFSWWPPLYS